MASPSPSRSAVRRLYWGLVCICFLGALAVAAIAAIPEESLRLHLVLVDRDASRHFLTPNQLFAVNAGLAALAASLLAAAAVLIGARARMTGYLAALAADFGRFGEQLREDLRRPAKGEAPALAAIVFVGFALRLYGLEHPWRFDESDSLMHFVRLDWFNLWTDYTQPNNHIFYNFLAHVCVSAFGVFGGASRLPTFVAGVAIVPAVYYIGRMLLERRAALLAAALAATLPPLIDFSTNARGYVLVTLLMLLSILAGSILRKRRSVSAWAAISMMMTAALFAVPTALFSLGTVLVLTWLESEGHRRRPLVAELIGCTAVCGIASILLYTPPAMRGTWAAIFSNPFVVPMRLETMFLRTSNYLALLWAPIEQPSVWLSAGIASVALLLAMRTATGRRLLLAVFVPAVAVCAAGRFMPPPRVWLYILPLIVVASAGGLVEFGPLRRNSRSVAVACCVALAIGFSLLRARTPGFELRFYGQVEQIADLLAPQLNPTEAIIVPTPMSDPLQIRLLGRDPELRVGFDPRDLSSGRRTLEGRSKVWVVRPRPDSYLGWENGRREFDLSQPYLAEFAEPRLVTTTEYLEVWSIDRR